MERREDVRGGETEIEGGCAKRRGKGRVIKGMEGREGEREEANKKGKERWEEMRTKGLKDDNER